MNLEELRTKAESILTGNNQNTEDYQDISRLIHELEVHQVELELQNQELRETQAELEAMRQRYLDLYLLAPVGYLVIDENGRIIELNLAASMMLELDRRFAEGTVLARFLESSSRPTLFRMLNSLTDSDQMVSIEVQLKTGPPHGTTHVKIDAVAYQDNGRRLIRLTMTDISDRMDAELALKASEERFRLAMTHAPEPMMVHIANGEVVMLNRKWTESTGYTMFEIPTISIWLDKAYPDPAVRESVRATLVKLYEEEIPIKDRDLTIRTREGRELMWQFSASVLGTLPDGRKLVMSMARDVTERRKAERNLASSEEKHRHIGENLPGAIYQLIQDSDHEIYVVHAQVNDQTADAFAMHPDEFIGDFERILKRMIPDDRRRYLLALHKSAETMTSYSIEYKIVRERDGAEFWFNDRATPIKIDGGRIMWTGISIDITDRKHGEDLINYQALVLQNIKDAVITTDLNYIVRSWNEPAEKMYGYTAEEALGRGMGELIPTEYAHQSRADVLMSFQDNGYWHGEVFQTNKHNARLSIHSSVNLIRNESGQPVGVVAVNRDITQRKAVELALKKLTSDLEAKVEKRTSQLLKSNQELIEEISQREEAQRQLSSSQQFLQSVIDGQPATIAVLDESGKIITVNENWRQYARKNGGDIDTINGVGLNYLETVRAADDEIVLKALEDVLAGKKEIAFHEYECSSPTHERWEAMSMARFIREGEKYVVVTHTDITERKMLENSIQNALEVERELNMLKTRFVSMISHEFRTPMTVILSSSSLLRDYFDRLEPEKRAIHLDRIMEQIKRLDMMLNEVSVLNKDQLVDHVLELQPIDLIEHVEYLIESVNIAQKKEVAIHLAGESKTIPLDSMLVDRIFLNLISNAVKYSPAGNDVHVSIAHTGEGVSVTIKDQGIGIPKQDQKHLFKEPFHRAANVGTVSGNGLGHILIYQAVEAHHGTISFESVENEGSTFRVTLPILDLSPDS